MKKNVLKLLFLLLLILIPYQSVWACDCDDDGPLYKTFPLAQDTGYFAQEFDKLAPAPGLDWTGDASEWAYNAANKGWVTKTSLEGVKVGALLIGYHYPTGVWVGILRNLTDSTLTYETLNEQGKPILMVTPREVLKIGFLGYILPEKANVLPKEQHLSSL